MKTLWRAWVLGVAVAIGGGAASAAPVSAPVPGLRWVAFPDPALELRGLPWFADNAPELWRFPVGAKSRIPAAVWTRAVAPDGGRIRFSSTTTRLFLRVQTGPKQAKACLIDVYVDGVYAGAAKVLGREPAEYELFTGRGAAPKAITVYLPNNHEVRVQAVGVDREAAVSSPPAFAQAAPVVCYGSSVLQGTGAEHPAQTYPAALARALQLDFVNLGFGGAGKAEPAVVELVNRLDAACFILDLGKSYGDQGPEPFVAMLATLRAAHPRIPILCVTPIYSSKEPNEPPYREKSERLRAMMREAALTRQRAGDAQTLVVEGLELFGPGDAALLHDPQHPNDEGNALIARRLAPVVGRVLGL
jgi:lysophospholipase L1-like esterase